VCGAPSPCDGASARALSRHPTLPPCNFFHHTLGIAGGDRLEALAVAFDEVSADVLHGRLSGDGMSAAVVKAAAEVVGLPRELCSRIVGWIQAWMRCSCYWLRWITTSPSSDGQRG
jgi:hypothetical protein